ncbi:polyprenyl synthetase family protein [Deltaproteobacteria bacterium TL4]
MNISQILLPLSNDLACVEKAIIEDIQTHIPLLNHVAEHILKSGGKRLRPVLVILAAQLFNKTGESVQSTAQVIEYLHTATLLHDDVVDRADMRRSQKSARNIWGNEASVLVGDYLFATAFHRLVQLKNLPILEVMSETTTLMAKGELHQLVRSNETINEEDYYEIIFNKTACLFAAAMKMGAILGAASEEGQLHLYQYGTSVGMAFQIVDDALDYMEEESKTGKTIGIDLQERKITLPLSHLLQNANPSDHKMVKDILDEPLVNQVHIAQVVQLMKRYDSIRYSLQKAKYYVEDAKKSLAAFSESSAKQMLLSIADFIVERTF